MGMRAVIADDEVLIRMYIREILENNGYEVAGEAEDGMDAVTVCREQRPDFVIMDINMPVMTGLEAARVIREESLAGFVVVLTAYRDKEIAEQAVDLDVMGYVVKPVDEDTLIPAVRITEKNISSWRSSSAPTRSVGVGYPAASGRVPRLPFIGNLESGDTYINVLTRMGDPWWWPSTATRTATSTRGILSARWRGGRMSRQCTGPWNTGLPGEG